MSHLTRSKDSYGTARLKLTCRIDVAVAAEVDGRFVEYRFRQEGGPGMSVLTERGKRYEPKSDDFIQSYLGDTNRSVDLIRRRPEWWSEIVRFSSRVVEPVVSYPGEIEWSYDAKHSEMSAMIVGGCSARECSGLRFPRLLDTTEEHAWHALWAMPKSLGQASGRLWMEEMTSAYKQRPFHGATHRYLFRVFGKGVKDTTDYQPLVDAEIVVIFSISARLGGHEYRALEAVSISFDTKGPDEELVNPLPEIAWRKWTRV